MLFSETVSWLEQHGGYFHPDATYQANGSGSTVVAQKPIPSDSTVLSCPFSLAITKRIACECLHQFFGVGVQDWSPRKCISSYLVLHLIAQHKEIISSTPSLPWNMLKHHPYVDSLPAQSMLRTALYFTPEERELFNGSNLYGAIRDREQEWTAEYDQCRAAFDSSPISNEFTWSRYLSSATYLSSRAFPSTILSPNPSLQSSPSSEPILLPGVDSLNHARGHPVSWLADYQSSSGPRISLVIHSDIPASAELFNNYGLKPNSELILGYGFSLPQNPDDTIVLQLGHSRTKWEVGRDAKGMDGLWEEILARMVMAGGGTEVTYEEVLDASSMLMEMNTDLMDKLPVLGGSSPAGVREEVYTMWSHYIEGQHSILCSIYEYAKTKEEEAIAMAQQQGIEIVLEEEEDY